VRVTRRQFLGASAGAALGAGAGALVLSHGRGKRLEAVAKAPPKLAIGKKNVILVITDTMRRDAVSAFADKPWVQTPNLDAFAHSGVMLSNAYLCSFPTVLARHDILTGTPTYTYKQWSPLDPEKLTLQAVLGANDIHTALIADTPWPYAFASGNYKYQRDFSYYHQVRGQEQDRWITGELPVRFPCDRRKLRDPDHAYTQYLKNICVRKCEEDCFVAQSCLAAIQWLKNNHARQPFFLMLDIYDPHEPWDAPQRYADLYDPGYQGEVVRYPRYDLWRRYLSARELQHCKALYAAETTLCDHWLGQFLDTVFKLGLLDNTLIVHLSDHGEYLGEHGYIGKGIIRDESLTDDLGQKKVSESLPLYPEMCRIPMSVHFPGCRPGTVKDGLVQPSNLAATVLDYLGIKKPWEFTEPSAWPLLKGDSAKINERIVCSPVLSDKRNMRIPRPTNRPTITDGRWFLVYACAGWADELVGHSHTDPRYPKRTALLSQESLDPQLYDTKTDPLCEKNVFSSNREVAADLHRWFVSSLERSPMRVDHQAFFSELEPGSSDTDEAAWS
jgi:arylsulfatase A-like enzyme